MSSLLYAKNIQSSVSGAPTASSTGYASNFPAFPRPSRRSHTTEKGYRNIDLQEHSFHFERACKDGESREAIQSPYVEGKKNKEYINPTFHSSLFLTQNATLRRAKTPDHNESRSTNPLAHYTAAPSFRVMSSQTPREDVVVSRKIDFVAESARVEHTETERRAGKKSVSIQEPVVQQVERIERTRDESSGAEKKLANSKSADFLKVCGGCHNWQLALEAAEAKKQQKDSNLEMERSVLDHNAKLLRNDQERENKKKEMLVSTSRSNYEVFSEKKTRNASKEGRDDDLEIKLNNKNMAAESIRSLKRYQSMLDKMYESSMNRHSEKKGDLFKSQSHNKASISKNEQVKLQEKKSGSFITWNINEGEKSLLDTMHERSMKNLEVKDSERRRASEYNRQSGSARRFSPAGPAEDPFKADTETYEKSGNGKSVLDKMYLSSMNYWQRQKDGLKDASKSNRETSALLKKGNLYNEEELIAIEYASPHKPSTLKGKSMLDIIHHSDQKGMNKRKDNTLNCSGFNKTQGYSQESAQLKTKNLDNYYKSPAKKVNKEDGVDYGTWTEEGGVFDMINSSAEKLYQNRRAQTSHLGSTVRQQMTEGKQRKAEQQISEKNFKQTPLLVCSHKANMACCAICNRQVPANKISKIIADYSKLAKGRGPAPKKY